MSTFDRTWLTEAIVAHEHHADYEQATASALIGLLKALADSEDERAARLQTPLVDETLAQVRGLVFGPTVIMHRSEAVAHAVDQPYADNRYVRLVDDLREILGGGGTS